jgi:DNA-binding NarL/FixJ family response regulator
MMTFEHRRRSAETWVAETAKRGSVASSDLFGVMERLLTPRQLEVMQLLDDGMNMADISRKLSLTPERIRQIRAVIGRQIIRAQRMLNWEETKRAITPNTEVSGGEKTT